MALPMIVSGSGVGEGVGMGMGVGGSREKAPGIGVGGTAVGSAVDVTGPRSFSAIGTQALAAIANAAKIDTIVPGRRMSVTLNRSPGPVDWPDPDP